MNSESGRRPIANSEHKRRAGYPYIGSALVVHAVYGGLVFAAGGGGGGGGYIPFFSTQLFFILIDYWYQL